jgi:glycosyltransferase involved in cell wall biosynthesis
MGEKQARVLLVVEQLRRAAPGGIGRYISGLLQGLSALRQGGDEVPDIVLHASRAPRGVDPLAAFGFPVHTSLLPAPVLTRAWDRGLVDAPGGVDVIHALSQAAPPARHAPLIVMVHDTAWRTVPDTFPERGRRWHEASFDRARRRATRLVVPSLSTERDVVAAGADAGSIVVIEPGADHLARADHAGTDRLLARLGVEREFLLSVGTLEPRKNLVRLTEAYRTVRDSLPGLWPLVVVGPDGWGESPVVAPGNSTDTGVVLTGAVDDGTLAGLYERARLLVYVPLTEGFGFPPVEAMRHGLPVVASAMPSLGDAGLVVDPLSVEAIGTAVVRAATDEDLRAELIAGGVLRTKDMTWAAAARAHMALWESVS